MKQRVFVFGCQDFEPEFLDAAAARHGIELQYSASTLSAQTAGRASQYSAVSIFANDQADRAALENLAAHGTRFIALRCAGFNQLDLQAAKQLAIDAARVPEYSPYSVAEHTVGLLLTLNRKLHRAWARLREQNFSLKGLLGFDLHGKTIGIIGLGKIGIAFARIMRGFGCTVLAYDVQQHPEAAELGIQFVSLPVLLQQSDVISLHCPLNEHTHHILNAETLAQTKPGVFLLNTGRGALIDSKALIQRIKSGHIGAVGLDVYEQESGVFFADRSGEILNDDVLARLMTFPNVFITGHQGFFTREAVQNIADTTMQNLADFFSGRRSDCWLT